jgi:hypothetical protein
MAKELEEKDELADQEFSGITVATLNKEAAPTGAHLETGLTTWRVRALLAISLVFLGSIWYDARTGKRPQSLTTAVHAPVTLKDEVEHLPALAWKAIPLSLPYGGTVNIDIQVVGGNPIDVFVTAPEQHDTLKKMEWNNLRAYGDFSATRTKTYSRSAYLAQGGYYLVVRDMLVAIPSLSTSDISVNVRLNP